MTDTYYTPEIEEFHVGFEYESMGGLENINAEWHDEVYSEEDSVKNLINTLRVKYLDQEDIESLGFEHIGALWFESAELDCRIRKWKGLQVDIYYPWSKNDGDHTSNCLVFRGKIKNKSELKKLLNQVNE